jgi:hypothetical protein
MTIITAIVCSGWLDFTWILDCSRLGVCRESVLSTLLILMLNIAVRLLKPRYEPRDRVKR